MHFYAFLKPWGHRGQDATDRANPWPRSFLGAFSIFSSDSFCRFIFFLTKLSHKFFYVFDSFPYVCHRCVPSCPILSVLKQESDLSEFEHPTDYPDLSGQLPGGGTLDTSAIEETAVGILKQSIWNLETIFGGKDANDARRREGRIPRTSQPLKDCSQTIHRL